MHWFEAIRQIVQDFGLWGVFFVMVIENIGIPLPTEIGFLVAQGLIAHGQVDYVLSVAVITAGHVAGAILGYGIGRWGDKKLTRFFSKSDHLKQTKQRVTDWYAKYGSATIFATRNFGYVRPWASLVAGFAKMPFGPFLIWTIIGSAVFSVLSLYLTKYVIYVWQNYPEMHIALSIVFGIMFFGLIGAELGREIYARVRGKSKSKE